MNMQSGLLPSRTASQMKLSTDKYILTSICSHLDYCSSTSHMRLVRKPATSLLSDVKHRNHLAAISLSLCWLPATFRIPPATFTDLLTPHQPDCSLRSSGRAVISLQPSLHFLSSLLLTWGTRSCCCYPPYCCITCSRGVKSEIE